jgi:hypothetical protein
VLNSFAELEPLREHSLSREREREKEREADRDVRNGKKVRKRGNKKGEL